MRVFTILAVGRNPDPLAGIALARSLGIEPFPVTPVMGVPAFEIHIDETVDVGAILQAFRNLGYTVEERQ